MPDFEQLNTEYRQGTCRHLQLEAQTFPHDLHSRGEGAPRLNGIDSDLIPCRFLVLERQADPTCTCMPPVGGNPHQGRGLTPVLRCFIGDAPAGAGY